MNKWPEIIEEARKICLEDKNGREIRELKQQLARQEAEIEALGKRLGELPKEVSADFIYRQVRRLEASREARLTRLEKLEAIGGGGGQAIPAEFADYQRFVEFMGKALGKQTDPEIRAKIVRRLISKVEVGADEVKIHYYTDKDSIGAVGNPTVSDFLDKCLFTYGNGWGGRIRTDDQRINSPLRYRCATPQY